MIPEISSTQFKTEVVQSVQPVLVDFFTPSCFPCRQMLPIITEVAEERSTSLKVVKFDAAKDPEIASRFRVTSVPNLILFQAGSPIGQHTGTCSKQVLLAWLDSTLSSRNAQ